MIGEQAADTQAVMEALSQFATMLQDVQKSIEDVIHAQQGILSQIADLKRRVAVIESVPPLDVKALQDVRINGNLTFKGGRFDMGSKSMKWGTFGVVPVARVATPTDAASIITAGRSYGWWA